MQLIGIEILQDSPVNKILGPGWYPFGNFGKPNKYGYAKRIKSLPKNIHTLYNGPDMPDVTVNAIVGKNGSGKSSILEIMFRIINNFAKHLLGKNRSENDERFLYYAYGVHASLYYIIDNLEYRIICRNISVTFERVFPNQMPESIYIRNPYNANEVLSDFFYTIATNYSMYAYNSEEYGFEISEGASNKNICGGEWLNGLFHKNDGYFTPLVITPFRNKGTIDIANETKLSLQRIITLAIFAEMHQVHLLPNYRPYKILKEFDTKYRGSKNDVIAELLSQRIGLNHSTTAYDFIKIFEKSWRKRITTDLHLTLRHQKLKANQLVDTSIYYLAYKTIKLALTYDEYFKQLKLSRKYNIREYLEHLLPNIADSLIILIVKNFKSNQEHNHLLLKIEQTYRYLQKSLESTEPRGNDNDSIDIGSMIMNNKCNHYSDVYTCLPPPFFNLDLKFKRIDSSNVESNWEFSHKDEIRISQMSSGERQMLNVISYVLYHIKNIESVHQSHERAKYHNICLIFDEAELYFHPEYQRTFIARLIESLGWCGIDKSVIHSIQILIVTHSPFVLTDILTENTLYLDAKGKHAKVNNQSFGANYYSLLADNFFFADSSVGKYATNFISDLIRDAHQHAIQDNLTHYIGDVVVQRYIQSISRQPKQTKHKN